LYCQILQPCGEQIKIGRNTIVSTDKLSQAQQQLVQSEKLPAIGQLAAGVAHEINNAIGFVNSNFNTLDGYMKQFHRLLAAFTDA